MDRAVSYVQYMPTKPIKHGIKVFVLCCAVSVVLLTFEVYVGNNDPTKGNSALAVCDRLVKDTNLTAHCGRMICTDNYYTSVQLDKHIFEKYGWTIIGTIVPTDTNHGKMKISYS